MIFFLPLLYLTGKPFSAVIKNISYMSAPTCPFRRLRRHFSQGKASHTLLQRRFTPRKMFHLPSLRSRMTGKYLIPPCIKSAFYSSAYTCPFRRLRRHLPRQAGTAFLLELFSYFSFLLILKTIISFFLSVSFPRTRREVPSLRGDRGMRAYTGKNI